MMAHTPAVAGLKWRFLNGLQTPKNSMASVKPETVLPALPIVMAGPLLAYRTPAIAAMCPNWPCPMANAIYPRTSAEETG
jgi:hypothetical protein